MRYPQALVLGLVCYVAYAVALALWQERWPPDVYFVRAVDDARAVSYGEIAWVTFVAVLVGFAVSLAVDRHWLNRFAKFAGISDKFGNLDVWSFTFNSSDVTDYWVVVRDIGHDLAFEGWVNAFSDTADPNELLLRDVRVYTNKSAEFLYAVDYLCVARKREDLTIEFRKGEPLKGGLSNETRTTENVDAVQTTT